MQAGAAGTDVCPRWNCPCVASQQQALQLFTNKRPSDSTSHFRRTTLAAAEKSLLRTEIVLDRIVSNHH